jgi:hypothetical protein
MSFTPKGDYIPKPRVAQRTLGTSRPVAVHPEGGESTAMRQGDRTLSGFLGHGWTLTQGALRDLGFEMQPLRGTDTQYPRRCVAKWAISLRDMLQVRHEVVAIGVPRCLATMAPAVLPAVSYRDRRRG